MPEKTPKVPRKHVADVLPDQNLWPDLDRRDLNELAGEDLIVDDFALLTNELGEFAILKVALPADPESYFTTACGGGVVLRKLKALREGADLPILGKFTSEPSQKRRGANYWNLS